MVVSDKTVTLERHMRRIIVQDGPAIKTKKGKKATFQVTEVRLVWYADEAPLYAMAHGSYQNGKRAIQCSRKYDLDGKEPKWLRKLING